MNSGSEKKLSMDELMAMNRPIQTVSQPVTEVHPAKEEWSEMMDCLYTLGRHAAKQTSCLMKLSELLPRLPSRTQMDELLKQMAYLEQMAEQAGNRNGRSSSLRKIRFPRLRLPRPDGPTWAVLLMAVAALLLLLWWGLGGAWHNLSQLLR